jgi:hypothetical protein
MTEETRAKEAIKQLHNMPIRHGFWANLFQCSECRDFVLHSLHQNAETDRSGSTNAGLTMDEEAVTILAEGQRRCDMLQRSETVAWLLVIRWRHGLIEINELQDQMVRRIGTVDS